MNVAQAKITIPTYVFIFNKTSFLTPNEEDRRGAAMSGVSSSRSSSSENNFRRICEIFNDELETVIGGSSGSLFEAKLCINESRSAAGGSDSRV
jgi:hypothetical protein